MSNIPGISGYVVPSVYSRVRTIQRSISTPGGLRLVAIIGQGAGQETIILDAKGNGADGVNSDYTGSNLPDGRHFVLSKANIVPHRTTLLLNGIPLNGLEENIDLAAFDSRYDYRLETPTGRIELQRASLVDQGGTFSLAGTSNVGDGTISVTLIDVNAPTETWTIRATSVIRDAYGDAVSGNATFTATGSVSGQPLDAYGAPIIFVSDGTTRDNGILQLTITEGSTAFERNDRFTVKSSSRQLRAGDTLEATYIANQDLYDPEFFTDPNALYAKHGFPSIGNTLSLGANMSFDNGAFGVLAVQAKPTLPRRTSDLLVAANDPLSTTTEGYPQVNVPVVSDEIDAFQFPIDKDGIPDVNSAVNIFVIDGTSGAETQIFPTKVGFYDTGITSDPFNNFIATDSGFTFSYTVIESGQIEDRGTDGIVTDTASTFTAASVIFSDNNLDPAEDDTNKQIRILNKDRFGNDVSAAGVYDILSVDSQHTVTLTNPTAGGSLPFTSSATDLLWELIDPADKSAYLLLTADLAVSGTISRGDGLRITYIDQNDATFYDNNWVQAYETLESIDAQIIVPLPDQMISAVFQAGQQHVELMSSTANKKERMLFIGAITGITPDALTGNTLVAVENLGVLEGIQGDDASEVLAGNIEDLANYSIAANYGTSFRVVYFFPDQIVRVISGTATNLPGFYMAAAAGGYLSAQANYALPLTRKILTGFTITRDRTYRNVVLNALGNAGACTVVPVVGGGQVLHGKTTVQSGAPEEEEISIVFIRDRVAQVLRSVLLGFIGQPEDTTLVAAITSSVTKTLQALVGQNLITDFANISVNRDAVEARQWNVSCQVAPTFPVTWIFIDIGVGLI